MQKILILGGEGMLGQMVDNILSIEEGFHVQSTFFKKISGMIDIRKKIFFGSKKNFSEYLIRSKNVKFIDFSTNINISI